MMPEQRRNSIYLADAKIVEHQKFKADQYQLRIHAPEIASRAKCGQFVHLTVDPSRPLRRPISIMGANPNEGTIDLLYKVFGNGTAQLATRTPGERISVLGPIGNQFQLRPAHPRPLLIGGGIGIPPMVFIADTIRKMEGIYMPFAIFGSEVPFPFPATTSKLQLPGIDPETNATMPLLEQWQVPCRLTSQQGYPGCYSGYVTDLARLWLDALDDEQRGEVEVFACGPHPMLQAVADLAHQYRLPCQVSVEEFMACGVGGCAGCTIEVLEEDGPAMRRVCVDGPIFPAEQVFPQG